MKSIKILFSIIALTLLAGCGRMQPIMNISDTPVGYDLSAQEVKQALTTAATNHKWVVTEVKPGELKGEIFVRSHHAVIKMTYSDKFYSISYVSSDNLKYHSGNIHRNYNRWINNINLETKQNLARSAANK